MICWSDGLLDKDDVTPPNHQTYIKFMIRAKNGAAGTKYACLTDMDQPGSCLAGSEITWTETNSVNKSTGWVSYTIQGLKDWGLQVKSSQGGQMEVYWAGLIVKADD